MAGEEEDMKRKRKRKNCDRDHMWPSSPKICGPL
jgi:hypothetical protein